MYQPYHSQEKAIGDNISYHQIEEKPSRITFSVRKGEKKLFIFPIGDILIHLKKITEE